MKLSWNNKNRYIRRLNKPTKKDQYIFPDIQTVSDFVENVKYFTLIDVISGNRKD